MSEIKGKLIVKGQTIVVSEKFSKREFVIETPGEYPQNIIIQLQQDKCALLDSVNLNDEVSVSVNIRGRKWDSPQGETKHFNTLEAWKIDKLGVFTTSPQPQQTESVGTVDDSLPF